MNQPLLNLVPNPRRQSHRFDIFKGTPLDSSIHKKRSVGTALLIEGHKTYSLHLNTLMKDTFYLVPSHKRFSSADYVIMSRKKSFKPHKKYIWKPVGEATLLPTCENPVLHLVWDLFQAQDIYMSLVPVTDSAETLLCQALKHFADE